MQNWRELSAMLLQSVDSEFTSTPVYLFDSREIEDDLCSQCGYRAYTAAALDLELSPKLLSCDQWRGRGFAAVFDIDYFDEWSDLFGCVLHEAAHFLEGPKGTPAPNPVKASSEIRQLLAKWAAQIEPNDYQPQPWSQHGQQFVRAACHLAYRVNRFASISPDTLQFSRPYYGSKFTEGTWMDALAGELKQSADKPIRDVLKTPAPAPFKRHWMKATQSKNVPAQTAAKR